MDEVVAEAVAGSWWCLYESAKFYTLPKFETMTLVNLRRLSCFVHRLKWTAFGASLGILNHGATA